MEKILASGLLFWGLSDMIGTKGEQGLVRSTLGLGWIIDILTDNK